MNERQDKSRLDFEKCEMRDFYVKWLMIILAMLLLGSAPVYATEGNGSAYLGGNEDFMAGALPPPGNYAMLYTFNYSADELIDDSGDDLPIDFSLDVYGAAFRFVHVTTKKLFGADIGWHLIVPFVSTSIEIAESNVDASSSGLGDIEVGPCILAWHFNKNWHLIGGVDFWLPVGSYDQNDPSSIGRNYWTIAPIVVPTYISNSGFEISAKLQYLVNFENSDTDYTSGNEFICDYLIGQHVGDWKFGVNGYIYQQITDDEQSGSTVEDNKGQCISIGPAIQYNYKNMFFNAKAQFDTSVKNRPEGQKFWVKFMYAF